MSTPNPARPNKVYPPYEEIIAKADADIEALPPTSIKGLITKAKQKFDHANLLKDLHRPDHAIVEFIVATTIISKVIPKHPDYPTFAARRDTQDYKDYLQVQKITHQGFGQVELLQKAIKANNARHLNAGRSQQQPNVVSEGFTTNGVANGTTNTSSQRKKEPPLIGRKPERLSGPSSRPSSPGAPRRNGGSLDAMAIGATSSSQPSDLEARFERLKMDNRKSLPLDPPIYNRLAPLGPREMPQLPKVDTAPSFPRPPSPTYSPINPPKSISRKPVATAPPTITSEMTVSADALYTYLQRTSEISLLLLDVRSREGFDEGHIYHRSIVCVEPITLRDGISGDNLEDSFHLSTVSTEHKLFSERHKFDLVVYYDQSTKSNAFLTNNTNDDHLLCLKRLHAAICDYSYGKSLKHPPKLLLGGLDAWINVIGPTSLKGSGPSKTEMSNVRHSTSNLVERTMGLGISTVPSPFMDRRSDFRNRQTYRKKDETTPVINIAEEQAWMQRLQKDREPLTITMPQAEGMDLKTQRRSTSIVSSAKPYYTTVEEYFQQFPNSPGIKQSMMSPIPPTPVLTGLHSPSASGFSPPALSKRNTIIDHKFHGFTDVRNPEFNPPPSPVRPPPAVPRKSYSGVSERPSIRPAIGQAPPLIHGHGLPHMGSPFATGRAGDMNIATGLKNLGNTCYMNSILQCMNGTIPLVRYFQDGSYKQHSNKENVLGSRGVLAEAFASVIKHLWDGQYKFISPMTLKEVSGRLNEMFKTDDQQDAQEFLEFLLDGLHEDLNPNANRTKLRELTAKDEQTREQLPVPLAAYHEWGRYTHLNSSVIVNWFQGQLSSRLTCMSCKTQSTTYTPFMYLSLPIPAKGKCSLRDCIAEFLKEEVLEKEDAWHCPTCKKPRRATKQLTITRLPMVLIIHFKRFANKGPWRDKLNTPVDFPLKNLNLTAYVPQLTPELAPRGTEPPPEQTPPFIYDLYGVCNHYGTLNGGHYISFVRNSYSEVWNQFDDSKASVINEESVVNRNAYVLFWVRKHIM